MNMEKQKGFVIKFLFWVIVFALVYCVLKYALPFFAPFVIAFLIAFLLNRPISLLSRKCKCRRTPPAILLTILFFLAAGSLILLIGARLFALAKDVFLALPGVYDGTLLPLLTTLFGRLEELISTLDPSAVAVIDDLSDSILGSLGSFVSDFSVGTIGVISNFAASVPASFLNLIITIIVTFFMTIDYDTITGFVLRQFSEKGERILGEIKTYVTGTLVKCILSYALIMCITFTELSIGLSILRVPQSILIALCISIFDILPVLGTGGIMIPWAIICLVTGNYFLGVGLLILYLVITVIRNIIEPRIVGHQVGLHPVVTLASMLAGLNLFGIIGLFGFPITLSLLKNLNDKGTIHIFR